MSHARQLVNRSRRRALCTLGALLLVACSSQRQSRPEAAASAQRIVAIGDLHGDVAAARRALRLAAAIDPADHWIGHNLTIVQTGDQLDRGDDERELLDLLDHVQTEAKQAGGAVVILNGNHELMNVVGDFRYVTKHGFESFAAREKGNEPQPLEQGRRTAFAAGGAFAKRLAERPVIAAVGGSLFAHGGVLLAHVQYGFDRLNREVSAFMRGTGGLPALIMQQDSPVWTRLYSDGIPSAAACTQLGEVLRATHTKRLVVGHTVQPGINSACDDRVWRIDVGLSRFYAGPSEVLEIDGTAVHVLREPGAPH